jgi:hypothetical protein
MKFEQAGCTASRQSWWTAAVNLQGGFGEGIFRSGRTMRLSAA